MPTRRRKLQVDDKRDLLERNVKIDRRTVAAHEKLEQELKKLGVEIKPSYNLEPPLGRSKILLQNGNR